MFTCMYIRMYVRTYVRDGTNLVLSQPFVMLLGTSASSCEVMVSAFCYATWHKCVCSYEYPL
jgi:hypothetical protein